MTRRLGDVVKVLRSKNAGAFEVTFDIFFHDRQTYDRFKGAGLLSPELMARLYHTEAAAVRSIHWLDDVWAVKVTMARRRGCGEPGDTDLYACQQYLPLWYLEISDDITGEARS